MSNQSSSGRITTRGAVAQEVQQVLPELALEGSDGTWSVSYGRMSAVLVAAMQEQQQTIERQQRAIDLLLARTDHLSGEPVSGDSGG